MTRFAICDDQEEHCERLECYIISEYDKYMGSTDKAETYIYNSGEELINRYAEDKIDIFFIDIECGNMNGFDIARRIVSKKKNAGIVYYTSYSVYVLDAFVCRPLGFIRKDYIEQDVTRVMYNICDFLRNEKRELVIKNGKVISLNNVSVVEVFMHNVVFHEIGSDIKIRATLSEYEDKLEHYDFIRISRSVMVNPDYVDKREKDCLIMKDGNRYNISRDRLPEVRRRFV